MFHLVNSGFFYIVLCECTRKQFPKRILPIFSILFGNKNSKRIRLAEFCHDLSAHTARIQIIVSISIDRNCCKLTLSLIDCLKKCCTLRTVCRRISCVFNIASLINLTAFCYKCRSNPKMEKQEFDRMEAEELIKAAMEAKEHAYVPYSHFRVGAALPTNDILFTFFIVI